MQHIKVIENEIEFTAGHKKAVSTQLDQILFVSIQPEKFKFDSDEVKRD